MVRQKGLKESAFFPLFLLPFSFLIATFTIKIHFFDLYLDNTKLIVSLLLKEAKNK